MARRPGGLGQTDAPSVQRRGVLTRSHRVSSLTAVAMPCMRSLFQGLRPIALTTGLVLGVWSAQAQAESLDTKGEHWVQPLPVELLSMEAATEAGVDPRFITAAPISATAIAPLEFEPFVPQLPVPDAGDEFLPEAVYTVKLVIDLSDRNVTVYQADEQLAQFPIAIGRSGWETPVGEHRVMQMVTDPAWEHPWTGEVVPPGPDNPLGTRWIGFWTDGVNAIGFHGTPNEASVGTAASHGCIRMYNEDVVQLFEMVSLGSVVAVIP